MSKKVQSTDKEDANSIVRVAVCGEFRSGKSSVLNALFGANVLGDNVGTDERPFVYAERGEVDSIEYLDSDGVQIGDLDRGQAVKSIHLNFTNDAIKTLEFVEVPISTAEDLTSEQIDVVESSDILVWVTIASQAWRLTEKTIVETLETVRPKHCILAVSRADMLRKKADRDKLMARIERETSNVFQHVVFMSNSKSQIEAFATSKDIWQKTGAPELIDALKNARSQVIGGSRTEQPEIGEPGVSEGDVDASALVETSSEETPAEDVPAPEATKVEDVAEAAALESKAQDANIQEVAETEAAEDEPTEQNSHDVRSKQASYEALLGNGAIAGKFKAMTSPEAEVLLGDDDKCQELGKVLRKVSNNWLQTANFDVANEDFNISIRTSHHSLHFQQNAKSPTVFMLVDRSQTNEGMARIKFQDLCKMAS